ncbi:MAG TPA: hypothetical protein PKE04_09265 [Clostridia bacterium]|nr:hypothetical protein [Clostridia bacterium]
MKRARRFSRVILALWTAFVMAVSLPSFMSPLQFFPVSTEKAVQAEWPHDVMQRASPLPREWLAAAPHHRPHHMSKLRDLSEHVHDKGRYLWVVLAALAENLRFSGPPLAGVDPPYPSMTEISCEVALRLGGHAPPAEFYRHS